MTETPECDRLAAVADKSQAIGEFLDWLFEQGIHLCLNASQPWDDEVTWDDEVRWVPHHEGVVTILARYFDIDLQKVEDERRAILAELRELRGES